MCCAASYLAVSAASPAIAQQSSLPPVTVDAPNRQVVRPARPATAARGTTQGRRASRQTPRQVEPVRPVAPSTSVLAAPPAPYPGGQVAKGAQIGTLGTQSIFDVPFSVTSYTAKTIQDQQARSLTDVLDNEPSIRSAWSRNSYAESYTFRGFQFSPNDVSLNGLYGLQDSYHIPAELYERVEVIKGPTALINGFPPGGSIIGSINLVPKRATDDPITQIAARYISDSQFGGYADVGRRFGDNKEFGVRAVATGYGGDTPVDRQRDNAVAAAGSFDYRGEAFRAAVDVGYKRQRVDASSIFFFPVGDIGAAPKGNLNSAQNWNYSLATNLYAVGRAEYDLASNVTVYGAVGRSRSTADGTYNFNILLNRAGDVFQAHVVAPLYYETLTSEAGVRAFGYTGEIKHQVNIGVSHINQDLFFSSIDLPGNLTNIYNPVLVPAPALAGFQPDPPKSNANAFSGLSVSDTMSWHDRIFLTVGGRLQTVSLKSISPTGAVTDTYSQDAASPAVGLVVKPVERLSLFANYVEGLQQAGTAPIGSANAGQSLAPFVTKQVEVGAKYDFGPVYVTGSLFQITQPSTFLDPVTNIFGSNGEQRNRGAELMAYGQPLPYLRVMGGVMFLEGLLTKTAGGIFDGNTAIGVPDVQLNIGAEWDTPFIRNLTITGRAIHTTSQFVDQANLKSIPSWTRFDVGARYTIYREGKPIVIRFNIENVANEAYWSSSARGFLGVGAPRTYLLSSSFAF